MKILKEAGGRRPPASLKTSPLPRLDALAITPHLAGGGVRGGGLKAAAFFRSLLDPAQQGHFSRRYPKPRTVTSRFGASGSSSIFLRRNHM